MQRVRTFYGNYDEIEKWINEFIDEEKPLRIIDIKILYVGEIRVEESTFFALVLFETS